MSNFGFKWLGNFSETFGFRWLGHRSANYDRKCSCLSQVEEGYAEPNPSCGRCLGTGFLFTDFLIKGLLWKSFFSGTEFFAGPGRISTQGRNLITAHDTPIKKFDVIHTLDLDPDTAQPRQPFKITGSFIVIDSFSFVGDDKIEYWKSSLEERTISDSRPGPEGTKIKYKINYNG